LGHWFTGGSQPGELLAYVCVVMFQEQGALEAVDRMFAVLGHVGKQDPGIHGTRILFQKVPEDGAGSLEIFLPGG
jgi:hypothetical protein